MRRDGEERHGLAEIGADGQPAAPGGLAPVIDGGGRPEQSRGEAHLGDGEAGGGLEAQQPRIEFGTPPGPQTVLGFGEVRRMGDDSSGECDSIDGSTLGRDG